jgi:hypothetical protein
MTNGQPKPSNDGSKSNASASSQKRREKNKRYYESHRENNKVSKVRTDDVTQSDSLKERIPFKALQSNGSQITQPLTPGVFDTSSASTSVEKRKEQNRSFHASNKENYKVSNGDGDDEPTQVPLHSPNDASTPCASTLAERRKKSNKRYYAARKEKNRASQFGTGDVSTPTFTLPSVTDIVLTEVSRGLYLWNPVVFLKLDIPHKVDGYLLKHIS